MINPELPPLDIIGLLTDIFKRRGAESYLGERVTMSEHMLQAAHLAEQAGEPEETVVAALLHDIGHYTGEFPEDAIELGIDNRHEILGATVLAHFFPPDVTEPVKRHVDAKRYLCAADPEYIHSLSEASIKTLELQGGPMTPAEVQEFESNPFLETIIKVRRYDDAGKVPGLTTAGIDHYLGIASKVMDRWGATAAVKSSAE